MIQEIKGNIIKIDAEALVNTVNCVGIMGKGIALQFKQAFPDNFKAYEKACREENVKPGTMFIFETGTLLNPKFIINFPTKRHWKGKSQIEDIQTGLVSLIEEIQKRGIHSIAVPPLGCGNGGLDWNVVRPMIVSAFENIPNVTMFLLEPAGAPEARTMPVRTEPAKMTVARALFIKVIDQYLALAYRLTLLEIQKLAYFLQESGEDLKLKYEKGIYGPFAPNLNKVLERVEGHFTRGYGDSQKPDAELELLPNAVKQAEAFLTPFPDSLMRLERVAKLIEGFETPYGMELLSTVHWVACKDQPAAQNEKDAVSAVHAWNERKKNLFKPEHIVLAWQRLVQLGWISAPGAVNQN
jgi:O-acetyl-ADP-ribose deacetylase (regulator of RNase III)